MVMLKSSRSQARLKLTILSKQAEAKSYYDFYSQMKAFRLPDDVVECLENILKVTSKVAGKTIAIGKLVVLQLLEYVAQHPLQVAGLTVGIGAAYALTVGPTYALGVGLNALFTLIPELAKWKVIGSLLSKLALLVIHSCRTMFMPLVALAPLVGIVTGEIFDKKYPEVSESIQCVARDFFEFFTQLIDSIRDEIYFDESSPAFA